MLPRLIVKMKVETQSIKQSGRLTIIPAGISKKKKRIAAYMCQHPEVTNKSLIAREVGVDKNTVRRHYDGIREVIYPRNNMWMLFIQLLKHIKERLFRIIPCKKIIYSIETVWTKENKAWAPGKRVSIFPRFPWDMSIRIM